MSSNKKKTFDSESQDLFKPTKCIRIIKDFVDEKSESSSYEKKKLVFDLEDTHISTIISNRSTDIQSYIKILHEIKDQLPNVEASFDKDCKSSDRVIHVNSSIQQCDGIRKWLSKKNDILFKKEFAILSRQYLRVEEFRNFPNPMSFTLLGSGGVGKSSFFQLILPAYFLLYDKSPISLIIFASHKCDSFVFLTRENALLIEKPQKILEFLGDNTLYIADDAKKNSKNFDFNFDEVPNLLCAALYYTSEDYANIANSQTSLWKWKVNVLNPWRKCDHVAFGNINVDQMNNYYEFSTPLMPLSKAEIVNLSYMLKFNRYEKKSLISMTYLYFLMACDKIESQENVLCCGPEVGTEILDSKNNTLVKCCDNYCWCSHWNHFSILFRTPMNAQNYLENIQSIDKERLKSELQFAESFRLGLIYEIFCVSRILQGGCYIKIYKSEEKELLEPKTHLIEFSCIHGILNIKDVVKELKEIEIKHNEGFSFPLLLFQPDILNFHIFDIAVLDRNFQIWLYKITMSSSRSPKKDADCILDFLSEIEICKISITVNWVYIFPSKVYDIYKTVIKSLQQIIQKSPKFKNLNNFQINYYISTFDVDDMVCKSSLIDKTNMINS